MTFLTFLTFLKFLKFLTFLKFLIFLTGTKKEAPFGASFFDYTLLSLTQDDVDDFGHVEHVDIFIAIHVGLFVVEVLGFFVKDVVDDQRHV